MHTYIQTDIRTYISACIRTCIQTARKTDRPIDRQCISANIYIYTYGHANTFETYIHTRIHVDKSCRDEFYFAAAVVVFARG